MTLRELLERASIVAEGDLRLKAEATDVTGRDVTGIAYDSRQVKPGAIFIALRGVNADGTTGTHVVRIVGYKMF